MSTPLPDNAPAEITSARLAEIANGERCLIAESMVMARQLQSFDFLTGLYEGEGLTRDKVADEIADYRMILDRVPEVYCHATGGLLSKPSYDVKVMTAAIDDHIERLVEEDRSETLGPALSVLYEAARLFRSYGEHHRAKEDINGAAKAMRNRDIAAKIEAVLEDLDAAGEFDIVHVDGHGPLTRSQRAALQAEFSQ